MVKVVSHVPRNASGGKTQEGNHKGRGGAGKLLVFRRAKWRSGEEGVDPWEGGKAGRWLGEKGGWMVRAGLRAWGLGKVGKEEGRKVGVSGVVEGGSWPEWFEGTKSREVVERWRERSPLWLLERLPNLPVAQLAAEIGARGPVESVRERESSRGDVERRIQRWGARGVEWVVSVRLMKEGAEAEVWGWEGRK